MIIILSILLWNCSIKAQNDCERNAVMHLAAYNYIVNDSINQNKEIVVSDSIVDLDTYWFFSKLIDFPEEKRKLEQNRENKNYIWNEPVYSPCLSSLFCRKNNSAKNVIFFSQIEDNMLRADLLPHTWQLNEFRYDEMAHFTTGQIYLFIFDDDGTVKATFSSEIIYD